MAELNVDNEFNSQPNNDWGDPEEIDSYNMQINIERNNDSRKNNGNHNEWICTHCNQATSRLLAIKENDLKCCRCNAPLVINASDETKIPEKEFRKCAEKNCALYQRIKNILKQSADIITEFRQHNHVAIENKIDELVHNKYGLLSN
eukprot:272811_1